MSKLNTFRIFKVTFVLVSNSLIYSCLDYLLIISFVYGLLVAQTVKNPPAVQDSWV